MNCSCFKPRGLWHCVMEATGSEYTPADEEITDQEGVGHFQARHSVVRSSVFLFSSWDEKDCDGKPTCTFPCSPESSHC